MSFEYRDKPFYDLVTRCSNFLAALVGLIACSPLLLAIAAVVKLSDPRAPLLYRGRRVGKGGQPFTVLKFRTMTPGTEQRLGGRLIEKDSPRITPLGRLLRRRKLDELPQLLNVLRGDMNLVGPRPVREVFLEELRERIPGYDRRFLVRPGITGLAQVRGGYYTDPRDKLRYELLYIARRSLSLDAKLIAATLWIIAVKSLTMLSLLFFLLAFVIFLPTTFMPALHVSIFGLSVNIAFILIAVITAWWISAMWFRRRQVLLRQTPADGYVAGFILFAVAGAFVNPDVVRNLLGILYFCSGAFLLYFLACQAVERDERKLRRFMALLGVAAVAVSLYGIREYAVFGEGAQAARIPVVSTMGRGNVLALFVSMVVPILLYLLCSDRRRGRRILWGAGIFTTCVCVALTFSRSGFLTFSVAALTFLFRWRRRAFYGLLGIGLLLFVSARVMGDNRFIPWQDRAPPSVSRAVDIRGPLLKGLGDHIFLGVGWHNWKVAWNAPSSPDDAYEISLGPISMPRSLNNMYLTFLIEYGIVGLFLILLVITTTLAGIATGSRKIRDPSIRMLLWAIFSGGLAFAVNMMFFDSCYYIAVQSTFWLLLGLGAGIVHEYSATTRGWYRLRQFVH